MIKGITKEQEKIIKNILKDYPYNFFYYGSRVKGNFEKVSDLDILIKSENKIPLNIINEIRHRFDDSNLPYVVSLVDYHNIIDTFYYIENDLVQI